jgi:membrane associated rhomboid family serine protease
VTRVRRGFGRRPRRRLEGRAKALPSLRWRWDDAAAVSALLAGNRGAPYFSKPASGTRRVTQQREPILNVPAVVVATIAVLVLVHAGRELLLTPLQDYEFLREFAFIPARYDDSLLLQRPYPGGIGADVWTFVSYALIHGDAVHLTVNIVWLLPFGTAVARRFGSARFLLFFAITAAAGAIVYLATHSGEQSAMIGASAAISGFMAAAMRFVFQTGGPLSVFRRDIDPQAYLVPAAPLRAVWHDPRLLAFLAVWFGVNLLFGLGSVAMPGAEEAIAWQAHIGGFAAGLVFFAAFDPVRRTAA